MLSRKRLWPALMIFALFAGMPLCASATKRIYFAGYMGLNIMGTKDFSETTNNVQGELFIDDGESFAGAIGFKLTPQLRIEGELSLMNADLSGVSITNLGEFDIGGGVDSTFAMINLYYDFDVDWKRLRPFVGAGIGYGWHEGDITDVSGFAVDADGESSGYVWQVGGGARYPISETLSFRGLQVHGRG